ncbi:hypothetical protein ABZU86_28625 [Streptomyces sp. NPDC005271]|uniref:hypothetical protein n=1 Tax=unclassified Streptomyces TaxID=2593676 RepID=UPI0033AB7490
MDSLRTDGREGGRATAPFAAADVSTTAGVAPQPGEAPGTAIPAAASLTGVYGAVGPVQSAATWPMRTRCG